jgi:hypothetical protein
VLGRALCSSPLKWSEGPSIPLDPWLEHSSPRRALDPIVGLGLGSCDGFVDG